MTLFAALSDSLVGWVPAAPRAYAALAPHYDKFTRHHRHDVWLERLEALARTHGLSGRRVLDVGCGTGKSLLPLLRRGYDGAGCDVSADMLSVARAALPEVPLHRADHRTRRRRCASAAAPSRI
jgi:ubiquinone/menaquinone biosynthesis C-methylase UbiE